MSKQNEGDRIVEKIKVAELIPYINNSRTHSEDQVAQIASSIKEFGFLNPIIIDKDNGIIAGHGRVMAAKLLKIDEIPFVRAEHLTEAQKKAYVIADNQLALNADWNFDLLKLEVATLDDLDFDVDLLGFDNDFLESLREEPELLNEGLIDDDHVPEPPEEPVTKLGDVWLLGDHRLMCGDSTSIDAVERLMDGEKADMCFTSPPYNGATHIDYGTGRNKKLYSDQFEDNKESSEYIEFLKQVLENIRININGFCFWNISYNNNERSAFISGMIDHLYYLHETICWKKTGIPISNGLTREWEPIFCFRFGGENKHIGQEFDGETNFWKISNIGAQHENHSACFPVDLPIKAINLSTEKGGGVMEPFGGSGSTLIACEKTNRKCFMMELSEKYCDVIINRWQEFTGGNAILESSGESFNDLRGG